jgi:hypothetical protein
LWEWGGAILIAVGAAICIFLVSIHTIEYERDDVFQHLTLTESIPPGMEDDPMNTVFTVTNGSSQRLSKRHDIFCYTRFAVGVDGTSALAGIETARRADGTIEVGAGDKLPRDTVSSILDRGGDSESSAYLGYNFSNTSCADVTVIFWYSLQDQPDIIINKYFRLKAVKGTETFMWVGIPLNSQEFFCLDKYKGVVSSFLVGCS